jgi:hypothetical protein
MWLVYREKTDNCKILHSRKGCEYRPPELPHLSGEGSCAETRIVYEFFGWYYHGHNCLLFRDVTTVGGYNLEL